MNLQQAILQKFFKDKKNRIVLAHTPFGDIFFKEEKGNNEVYFALQIYVKRGEYSKNNPFLLSVYNIGNNKNEYTNFIKQGGLFKEPHLPDVYNKIFFREGLFEELIKVNSKSNYEVYIADKENVKGVNLKEIKSVLFDDFCELVLKYGKFD